jgi:hypothetical protein
MDAECLSLVTLAIAPFLFLGVLSWACTGRDLTNLFLAGTSMFLVLGAGLVGSGWWFRRANWVTGGVGLLVSAGLCFGVAGSGIDWIGGQTAVLTVRVVDAHTGRPVPGATVCLSHSKESEPSVGRTDADGKVELSHGFMTVGMDTLVQRTGVYCLGWETLSVEADGYQALRGSLERYTGMDWDLYGLPLPTVTVRLKRKNG